MPVLKGLNMAIYAMLSLQPPLAQVELPQYIDPEAADVTTETPFKATRYIEVPLNLQFAVGCSMVDQSIFTEHNTQAVAVCGKFLNIDRITS